MKLAIGTLTVLLSMTAIASAEQAKLFLCWPLSRVTGSSAIYDRPGGIEIGRLDPGATYNMGQEAGEIDGEMWREIGRAEVSMGWVKRTDRRLV